eukprot:CAMPEP_0119281066 /NCGR_PEP_ID=MMETSP1329-20130426/23970_1 /TAXON_ID=114041 /ORGANISM="Genus nov. species nov., Strain RCC1024" /LENGTH=116 /DNA_ID=CAMNT_0007281669 /DNA_START=136 /DNA_END=483 /DNA_ORIENTATION=-
MPRAFFLALLCSCRTCALARRKHTPTPRAALRAFERTTARFVATLAERRQIRRRPHLPPERTVLLTDLRSGDAIVADHAWLRGRDARALDAAALDEDVVFDAGVACYRKRGGRRDW